MTVNVVDITKNSTAAWLIEVAGLMVELEIYWPYPFRYAAAQQVLNEFDGIQGYKNHDGTDLNVILYSSPLKDVVKKSWWTYYPKLDSPGRAILLAPSESELSGLGDTPGGVFGSILHLKGSLANLLAKAPSVFGLNIVHPPKNSDADAKSTKYLVSQSKSTNYSSNSTSSVNRKPRLLGGENTDSALSIKATNVVSQKSNMAMPTILSSLTSIPDVSTGNRPNKSHNSVDKARDSFLNSEVRLVSTSVTSEKTRDLALLANQKSSFKLNNAVGKPVPDFGSRHRMDLPSISFGKARGVESSKDAFLNTERGQTHTSLPERSLESNPGKILASVSVLDNVTRADIEKQNDTDLKMRLQIDQKTHGFTDNELGSPNNRAVDPNGSKTNHALASIQKNLNTPQ